VRVEEAENAEAVLIVSFEVAAEVLGAWAEADDEDVAPGSEALADTADEVADGKAEDGEQQEVGGEEGCEEDAADFLLQAEDDEEDDGDGAVGDLAKGVADDFAAAGGIEQAVDVEGIAGDDGCNDAEGDEQSLDVGEEVEGEIEGEVFTEAIGQFEGCDSEKDIG